MTALLALLLAAGALPEASPLSVSLEATPEEISLGDHVQVRLSVEHDARDVYSLPAFDPAPLAAPPAAAAPRSRREDLGQGKARTTFELTLADYGTLQPRIPDLALGVSGPDGPRQLSIRGRPLKFRSLVQEEGEPTPERAHHGPKPPVPVKVRSYLWAWLLGGLLLAAALLLLWRRWRKSRPAPRDEQPEVFFDDLALQRLAALRADAPWSQGEGRAAIYALSEIVRGYLGARPGSPGADRAGALGRPGEVRQADADARGVPLRGRSRGVPHPPYPPAAGHPGEGRMSSGALGFAHPWALLGLLAAVPAAWLLRRRRGSLPRIVLPAGAEARAIPPSSWARLWWLPGALVIAAVALTSLGLSGPRLVASRRQDLSVEGIDIVVAFDLSTSMLAADFRPKDRITVAKEVLRNFIASRQNDRIGLVVFAGEAYTQCPLTLDYKVLDTLLDQVRTGVIVDGTAIGNALATAVNRLRESDAKSRVVILITDGDNNAGNLSPMQAAQIAKDLGIKVFTILIGKGGRVPYPTGTDLFGRTTYEPIEIDVNPQLLQQIASVTGGTFSAATDKESLEQGLLAVLDSLEKSKIYDASGSGRYDEWYARFFAPAALFGLLGIALRSTRMQGAP